MKHKLLFVLIMASITTATITFVLLAINLGVHHPRLWSSWLRSWPVSYMLAVLSMLFIGPRVQSLVIRILGSETQLNEEKAG